MLIDYLPYDRHCSKYFIFINSFDPCNNSMRKILLLVPVLKFLSAVITKYHELSDFDNRNLSSYSTEV